MEKSALDILWIIVASALVFIMQAGFAMVESGMTRSKNSINVAIKNLTDLGLSTLFFWAFGFAIMFGASRFGLFGTSYSFFSSSGIFITSFFIFQAMFCSTSATIVSGAVAERMKYSSYIASTILLTGLIYPVFGHWAWGGSLEGIPTGWLAKRGFVDFAGSTVVHSMGGWVSLALLLIIGTRTGRYNKDGSVNRINGSNIPMTVLGVFILWFGWIGFNGGSTLSFSSAVPAIILKTTLGASAGMIGALAIGWPMYRKPDINLVLNGSLAGLVAITASCHAVSEVSAVAIGAIGGVVMVFAGKLLERLHIDDAVDAIPVHLAGGIWGTLAVAFFGKSELLNTGLPFLKQLEIQALGIVVCAIWGFSVSFAILWLLNRFFPLRVSIEDEQMGLNKVEHGVSTEILDLYFVLEEQSRTGDISKRAPVEPFTEAGQIAGMYNNVLEKLESSTVERSDYLNILDNVSDGLFLLTADGTIAPYYSAALETIFQNTNIANQNFLSLLSGGLDPKTHSTVSEYLTLLFDAGKKQRTIEKLNPVRDVEFSVQSAQGGFEQKYLQFHFKRIVKNEIVTNVMVLVRDITRQKELALEVEETRQQNSLEMELFYRILHIDPVSFNDFLEVIKNQIELINQTLSQNDGTHHSRLLELFQRTHAIKGDADMLGLEFLTDHTHQMEENIATLLSKPNVEADDFLSVTISFSELKSIVERMDSLYEKWKLHSIRTEDMLSEKNFLSRSLMNLAERLSQRHGKKATITCDNFNEALIPKSLANSVKEILVQLVRNSLFHGIETEEIRKAGGKQPAGTISLSSKVEGTNLHIVYVDDGSGLDREKIVSKAITVGLLNGSGHETLSDKEVFSLIFKESFSTADNAGHSAGRGIGMSLVKTVVQRNNGKISLRSKKGKSLEIEIIFPVKTNE